MAHTIDEDTKKIVKAIVHGDQKRQSRRRAGKHTDFDRKAAEAIKAAKKELPLEGTDPEVRRHIIDKLYTSLLYNTPWELLGETYCCRRLFYEYRKEFCYLIAVHMEIIEPEGGSRQQAAGAQKVGQKRPAPLDRMKEGERMAKEWTNGFYTSKEWRKTRDAYYRIQCGRCERCMAEVLAGARRVEDINPGIIVHHKKELTPENINDPAVALSFDNLELLCDEHHNRQHKAKAKRYTFDAKGNLIESK